MHCIVVQASWGSNGETAEHVNLPGRRNPNCPAGVDFEARSKCSPGSKWRQLQRSSPGTTSCRDGTRVMRDCAMAHDDAPKFGNQNRHLRIPQYADDLDRYLDELLDEALEETF